jgi:putative endonuclease
MSTPKNIDRERKTEPVWYLYMIRCSNGALYTGVATDVKRRFAEHQDDPRKGAKYLRGKGPLELVFKARVGEKRLAMRLEYRVKRLSKVQKEQIVKNRRNFGEIKRAVKIPNKLE